MKHLKLFEDFNHETDDINSQEREEMIEFIMKNAYEDDDPKNDFSNYEYLKSLSNEELEDKVWDIKNYLSELTTERKEFDLFSPELSKIAKWIESTWYVLNTLPEIELKEVFDDIENCCGENAVEIIDGMFNTEKLHYYQNGSMGIDTGKFIEDFDEIKNDVEEILKKYTD